MRNATIAYVRTPITVSITAITAGLMYRALGADGLGYFAALLALLAPANIVASVYSIYAQRNFSRALLSGTIKSRLQNSLKRFWRLSFLSAPIGALALFLLGPHVGGESPVAYCTALAISAHFLIASSLYRAYLEASERFVELQLIAVGEVILRLAAAGTLFLFMDHRITIYCLAYSVTFLIVHLLLSYVTRARCLGIGTPDNGLPRARSVESPRDSKRHFRQVVVQQTAWQVDASGSVLAIERMHGPGLAGAWAVASQAGGYVAGIAASITAAARPAITNTDLTANSRESALEVASWTNSLTSALVTLVCVPLTVFSGPILRIWTGSISIELQACLWCFIIQALGRALTSGWALLLNARAELARLNLIDSLQAMALVTFLAASGPLLASSPYWLLLACAIFVLGMLLRSAMLSQSIGASFPRWLINDAFVCLGAVSVGPLAAFLFTLGLTAQALSTCLTCLLLITRLLFLIRHRPT